MTSKHFDQLALLRRDAGYIGASLARLPDQLADAWKQASALSLPRAYRQVTSVAVCGMGGSHLGADIVRSVFASSLSIPVSIIADYQLPAWVNRTTLVICCSYSGSTEETISCLSAARRQGAQVVVMTSGGKLAQEARRRRVPLLQFQPLFNPSRQPRLGIAYSLMGTLKVFHEAGILRITQPEVAAMTSTATQAVHRYGVSRPAPTNPAKRLAMDLHGRIPVLIGSEWMAGNLHTWTNQIHENAKTFAAWYQLPDLNHHLLEGLRNRAVTKNMVGVFVHDEKLLKQNQRRMTLTKKIVEDLGATTASIRPHGQTALEKSIDLLAFGGYVTWYLAAVRKVQPAPIPTVDALKKALAR